MRVLQPRAPDSKSPAGTTPRGLPGPRSWLEWERSFPSNALGCGGDIRLIAFITEPGPIRQILNHLAEAIEPPPILPARGPHTDWGEPVQADDDRDVFQASPEELPAIDIHGL